MEQHPAPEARATGRLHYPNSDFIRLVAASSVIFSHCYLIADGSDANEPFVRLLGPHNILGIYGVFTFFILSGFFVASSAPASASAGHFLWKRFLRIYPGLAVCALVCGLGLGLLFTVGTGWAYLARGLGFKYAGLTVLAPNYLSEIPGVQFYGGSADWLGRVINGSLWTIPQEIFCYLLLAAIFSLGLLREWPILLLLVAAFLAAYLAYDYVYPYALATNFVFVLPSFLCGVGMAFVMRRWRLNLYFALLCLTWGVIAAEHGQLRQLFPLFAAYPLIYLATAPEIRLPNLQSIGDASYGVYLYGWPTQQTVRALLGPHASWWLVLLIALPIAMLIGFASWHLIEKWALRLKNGFNWGRFPGGRFGRPRTQGKAVDETPAADLPREDPQGRLKALRGAR